MVFHYLVEEILVLYLISVFVLRLVILILLFAPVAALTVIIEMMQYDTLRKL